MKRNYETDVQSSVSRARFMTNPHRRSQAQKHIHKQTHTSNNVRIRDASFNYDDSILLVLFTERNMSCSVK